MTLQIMFGRTAAGRSLVFVAGLVAAIVAAPAMAQEDFPSRPIDLTIGFGAGGGLDSNVRMLAPYLGEALGQPVTVINQPGGGSVPWANRLARTEPDGYTIGAVGFPLLQNNSVLVDVDYDPATDFTFLGLLTRDPAVLAVAADSPYQTVSDLITAAQEGERIAIGATGVGSVDYMIALSVQRAAEGDVDFGIVNFDSTNEGVVATLGGSIDAMPLTASSALPYVESGQMRALAAGDDEPIEGLDAPTFTEAGVDLLVDGSYRAVLAPADLPDNVRQTLVEGLKEAIDNPEFRAAAAEAGLPVVYMPPDELKALSDEMLANASELPKP